MTAFVLLAIGGIEALIMRIQLAQPNLSILPPEMYDQLFTMHGLTMIFWYASPILSGFSNYLIPLMIGSRDMAYPRLNAFSYWTFLLSAVLLYIGPCMGQAPHGGWFAYVPFTNIQYSPGHGMDFSSTSPYLSIQQVWPIHGDCPHHARDSSLPFSGLHPNQAGLSGVREPAGYRLHRSNVVTREIAVGDLFGFIYCLEKHKLGCFEMGGS